MKCLDNGHVTNKWQSWEKPYLPPKFQQLSTAWTRLQHCCISFLLEARDKNFNECLKLNRRNIRDYFSPRPTGIYSSSHPSSPRHHSLPSSLQSLPPLPALALPWGISLLHKGLYHQLSFVHPRIKELFASASQRVYWAPKRFFLPARKETMSSRRGNMYEHVLKTEKTNWREQHEHGFPSLPQQPRCHHLAFQHSWRGLQQSVIRQPHYCTCCSATSWVSPCKFSHAHHVSPASTLKIQPASEDLWGNTPRISK